MRTINIEPTQAILPRRHAGRIAKRRLKSDKGSHDEGIISAMRRMAIVKGYEENSRRKIPTFKLIPRTSHGLNRVKSQSENATMLARLRIDLNNNNDSNNLQPLIDSRSHMLSSNTIIPSRPIRDIYSAEEGEALLDSLEGFIELFRQLKISTRRRSILTRARREGLVMAQSFNRRDSAFESGTELHRLLSQPCLGDFCAGAGCSINRYRMGNLIYINAVLMGYQDSPLMTEDFLARLDARMVSDKLDWRLNHERSLRLLLCEIQAASSESGDREFALSRMMEVADCLDRESWAATLHALLAFLDMKDDIPHENQPIYPWDPETLRRCIEGRTE